MATKMSQFYQVFFEESAEHLADMERLLLNLNVESPDNEELNAIFRAAHSIKGGAGTFGFKDMTVVAHVLESLLDRIRNHELTLDPSMVDLFLQAKDAIAMQLAAHREGAPIDEVMIQSVCERLEAVALSNGTAEGSLSQTKDCVTASAGPLIYEIIFAPHADTFRRGIRIQSLFNELSAIGTFSVRVDLSGAPSFVDLDAELCFCRWMITLKTDAGEARIREIFEFVADEDELQIRIRNLDQGFGLFEDAPGSPQNSKPALATPAVERPSAMTADNVFGRRAYDKGDASSGAFGRRSTDIAESSIRVNTVKVDRLVNEVGELVITQAMLAQIASALDPVQFARLHTGLQQLEKNTRDLQESIMSIRMVPISYAFSRFPRVVRDTAAMLGKRVELRMHGETTELDKGLIEKIADPLTHLVRNALDHGIESPEARTAAGKEPMGTITLGASQQEGKIVIEVADNGAGLNREKILQKAHEKGMAISENISDEEVWQLIFAPGFSTADVVTDVSGRGVGMDVVLRNVKEMGGSVHIRSERGEGTRFIVRVPLTLAILDGLSVRVGSEVFIIPLNSILESLQPKSEDLGTIAGKGRVVNIRGDHVKLVALHNLFNISGAEDRPEQGILTLVECDGQRLALLVDELVGQHQVVIKSLETNFRKVEGTAGATILGDGRVALILDVGSIAAMAAC